MTSSSKKMMHHNSKEFHDDLALGISPQDVYQRKLRTAVMGIRDFKMPIEMAVRWYKVKPEDIMKAIGRPPNVVPGSSQSGPSA